MKKILWSILFLSISASFVLAQDISDKNFTAIDDYVRSIQREGLPLEEFTKDVLTKQATTDIEKVRCIYVWITDNIRYDCKKFHKRKKIKPSKFVYTTEEERQQKLKQLADKHIRSILRKKKGICGDYSLLFKEMCSSIGIEAIMVTGHARTNPKHIGRKPRGTDHAWNAFKLNDQWFLVDATWGSGYTDSEITRFTKEFRNQYFMMPPKDLIKSHYPEDDSWQLLNTKYDEPQFNNQPIYSHFYWELGIEALSPSEGSLKSTKDEITFELQSTHKDFDPTKLVIVQGKHLLVQGFEKKKDTYQATIKLKRGSKQLVLGYATKKQQFESIAIYKLK